MLGKACFDVLAGRDVFGNVYCSHDCGVVKTASEGEDPRPFLLDVRKKGTGTVKIVVKTIALPETGPRFSCLMHFIEAEGDSAEPILRALRDSVRDSGDGDAPPAGPVPAPDPRSRSRRSRPGSARSSFSSRTDTPPSTSPRS